MFCPECREEFPWDVIVCPTCDVDTVDRLPGPEPTPDVALVRVLATVDVGIIAVAKSLLEGEAIDYFVKGDVLQNPFAIGPAEFWVREPDADRARELLEDLTASDGRRDSSHDV